MNRRKAPRRLWTEVDTALIFTSGRTRWVSGRGYRPTAATTPARRDLSLRYSVDDARSDLEGAA